MIDARLNVNRCSWLTALLLLLLAESASAQTVASTCPRAYPPQTVDITQPINLGQLKLQLSFYACSGAYDADLARVLADAQVFLEKRAGEVTKPAMVLDIDETSLTNLPEILANDFGYIADGPCDVLPKGPCGFNAWVQGGKATAVPGTLSLFKAARARGVAVFFITGRHENEQYRAATAQNLKDAGYEGWSGLVLRTQETFKLSTAGYKSGERGKIEAQGFTIILNVGDQQSDLDGGYAERTYKLPNPFYFLP